MKDFAIICNRDKDPGLAVTGKIERYLSSRGASVRVLPEDFDPFGLRCECLLVLGGDGTVLRAARSVIGTDTAILGINLGSLGYLTEISRDEIDRALPLLLSDDLKAEERMMIRGRIIRDGDVIGEVTALNDIVISRRGPLRVMRFENYVNGDLMSRINADGMIVSTPTGSTGYSLSAGGPVVAPNASLMILTPIAPHTINLRSVVLPDSDLVRIVIAHDRMALPESAMVYYDGEQGVMLRTGDTVEITAADVRTRMIRIGNRSFMDVLRQKMQVT